MQQNDVLSFELDRNDLQSYTIGGATIPTSIPYLPAWENNGTFYFQTLGRGRGDRADHGGGTDQAILNGGFGGLLPQEIDPFIDALLANGLVFQAYHQHFTDIHPNELYYIHFRGIGDPLTLAQGVIAAVKTTGTPLPQSTPANPTTPLPTDQLAQILGGSASVGSDGVVNVDVPWRDRVILGGVPISPFLNIATAISFEPLDGSGTTAAAAPDFSMVASEIQHVVGVMRRQGGAARHHLLDPRTGQPSVSGLCHLGGDRLDIVDQAPDWFIAGHRKEPTGRHESYKISVSPWRNGWS